MEETIFITAKQLHEIQTLGTTRARVALTERKAGCGLLYTQSCITLAV